MFNGSKAYQEPHLAFVHEGVSFVGIITVVVSKAEGGGWFEMAKAIRGTFHAPPPVRVLVEGQTLAARLPWIHDVPT